MNRISKLLTARDILLDVPATSKKRLFEHAALLFENEHRLERQKVFDSLFARERLGSTGLGKAVAIPHDQQPDGFTVGGVEGNAVLAAQHRHQRCLEVADAAVRDGHGLAQAGGAQPLTGEQ